MADLGRTSRNCCTIIMGDMNAKLGTVHPGEEDYIGPYVFQSDIGGKDPNSNRELLVEVCMSHDIVAANTFFETSEERKISYRNLTTRPMENVSACKFSQIDHVLCSLQTCGMISDIWTDRSIALNSHHFVMMCSLSISFPKL